MRTIAAAIVLAFVYGVSHPNRLLAKGSGGHGGGHSSGHSGGHSSHGGSHGSSHGSSGHGSSSHGAGARTSGTHGTTGSASSAPHARSATRSDTTPLAVTSTNGARPRGGRPILGTAVPRPTVIPAAVPTPFFSVPLIVWPRFTGGLGFGGFGFFGYPWHDQYPLTGMPYDQYPGVGTPYDQYPGTGAYAPDPFDRSGLTGKLRLRIEPRTAEVFVDGYYAGIVDDFDGMFQHLTLAAGPHHIVVRAPEYQLLFFDVMIEPHHTTTYRGVLQR
jgi:hypothetical protein